MTKNIVSTSALTFPQDVFAEVAQKFSDLWWLKHSQNFGYQNWLNNFFNIEKYGILRHKAIFDLPIGPVRRAYSKIQFKGG